MTTWEATEVLLAGTMLDLAVNHATNVNNQATLAARDELLTAKTQLIKYIKMHAQPSNTFEDWKLFTEEIWYKNVKTTIYKLDWDQVWELQDWENNIDIKCLGDVIIANGFNEIAKFHNLVYKLERNKQKELENKLIQLNQNQVDHDNEEYIKTTTELEKIYNNKAKRRLESRKIYQDTKHEKITPEFLQNCNKTSDQGKKLSNIITEDHQNGLGNEH